MDDACRIVRLLDLTNLDDGADAAAIDRLCARASTRFCDVAALCVHPQWVRRAVIRRPSALIRVASVANFPHGSTDAAAAARTAAEVFASGADEVDVVLPWRAFRDGDVGAARKVLRACRGEVPFTARMKVILETGELASPESVGAAARLALDEGADFLKTSTGKTATGATIEAARILLETIHATGAAAGVKASGGIRTGGQAEAYLDLAASIMGEGWISPDTFRFGASSLIDDLLPEPGRTAHEGAY
ncbi:MAG TPA: deoxyribose-phosphate aldolase [Aestuariivirgaceae bacterium]|nr:deoxyribose-phosphate aldolase [Aestuariivirgaceae bacterium]